MLRFRLVTLLIALAVPPTAAFAQNAYVFRPVALTGDAVSGVPGATLRWFVTHPGAGDSPPDLDAAGQISFVGGWGSSFTPPALFREQGLAVQPVAAVGDAAVGGPWQFAFPEFVTGAARLNGVHASFDASVIDGCTLRASASLTRPGYGSRRHIQLIM